MNLFSSIGAITKIPVALLVTGILFSCVNDLDAIQQVADNPDSPDEVMTDVYLHQTDSGYARVQIYAAVVEKYMEPEEIAKLKEEVKVNFFSDQGEIVSILTAKYGEINFETGLMVVRDSVRLRNLKRKQWLETEELYHHQNDSTVYTDKFVIIKREGKGVIGKGQGIKTHYYFNNLYRGIFNKPEGDFYFD